jgi:hypothetical protein
MYHLCQPQRPSTLAPCLCRTPRAASWMRATSVVVASLLAGVCALKGLQDFHRNGACRP